MGFRVSIVFFRFCVGLWAYVDVAVPRFRLRGLELVNCTLSLIVVFHEKNSVLLTHEGTQYELLSKLLVSPVITPIVVPYINPLDNPLQGV